MFYACFALTAFFNWSFWRPPYGSQIQVEYHNIFFAGNVAASQLQRSIKLLVKNSVFKTIFLVWISLTAKPETMHRMEFIYFEVFSETMRGEQWKERAREVNKEAYIWNQIISVNGYISVPPGPTTQKVPPNDPGKWKKTELLLTGLSSSKEEELISDCVIISTNSPKLSQLPQLQAMHWGREAGKHPAR